MTAISDKNTKEIPTEYMGYYKIKDNVILDNGRDICLIEEQDINNDPISYMIVFNENDIVYTIGNIYTKEMDKEIAESFKK